MIRCPICTGCLDVNTAPTPIGDLRVHIRECEENDQYGRYNILLTALREYWRWCAEGRPVYRDKQHYYDGYRRCIGYLENDTYSFRIQVSDDPYRDTWWEGTCRLNGDLLEIITDTITSE